MTLPIPTTDIVLNLIARFDSDHRYGPADRVLSRVFTHHPFNDALEDVLIKVVLLNGLYNTNVLAVMDMACHIRDLGIDVDLATSSSGLVDRIARLRIGDKTRRHYSFATKYCNWHRPEDYPIYDALVEKLLLLYQQQYSFAEFAKPDLRDYPRYKAIMAAFRVHFSLEDLSFKQIDKFLWWTSKDLGL